VREQVAVALDEGRVAEAGKEDVLLLAAGDLPEACRQVLLPGHIGAMLLPEEEADAVLVDQVIRGSEHGVASALKVKKGRAKVKGKSRRLRRRAVLAGLLDTPSGVVV
jgi:hypothetical protein